jgi:hypothetical protein
MVDKVAGIARLVAVLAQLGEEEFVHVWGLIHAVKQEGTPGALLRNASPIPEIPKQ